MSKGARKAKLWPWWLGSSGVLLTVFLAAYAYAAAENVGGERAEGGPRHVEIAGQRIPIPALDYSRPSSRIEQTIPEKFLVDGRTGKPYPDSIIERTRISWRNGLPAVAVGEFGTVEKCRVLEILDEEDMVVDAVYPPVLGRAQLKWVRAVRLTGWPTKGLKPGDVTPQMNIAIIGETPYNSKPVLWAVPLSIACGAKTSERNNFPVTVKKHFYRGIPRSTEWFEKQYEFFKGKIVRVGKEYRDIGDPRLQYGEVEQRRPRRGTELRRAPKDAIVFNILADDSLIIYRPGRKAVDLFPAYGPDNVRARIEAEHQAAILYPERPTIWFRVTDVTKTYITGRKFSGDLIYEGTYKAYTPGSFPALIQSYRLWRPLTREEFDKVLQSGFILKKYSTHRAPAYMQNMPYQDKLLQLYYHNRTWYEVKVTEVK